MKARPILFKPDMVRAILDGRKTETRRIVKAPVLTYERLSGEAWDMDVKDGVLTASTTSYRRGVPPMAAGGFDLACPYGVPGDVLWVREAFSGWHGNEGAPPSEWDAHPDLIWYWADGNVASFDATRPKPSIHMPKWASRLTLEITDVRVERLQDISEEDAECEGVVPATPPEQTGARHKPAFRYLWEGINGEKSWAANPWVWVVEFRPHHMNVDAFLDDREVI